MATLPWQPRTYHVSVSRGYRRFKKRENIPSLPGRGKNCAFILPKLLMPAGRVWAGGPVSAGSGDLADTLPSGPVPLSGLCTFPAGTVHGSARGTARVGGRCLSLMIFVFCRAPRIFAASCILYISDYLISYI